MIREKLYLPTSTLNFNNIFSSESISPQSFYSLRNFGYKRFTVIKPNPLSNSLLLYNKYPIFDLDDKEKDNYPLVIQFSEDFFGGEEIIDCVHENGTKVYQINKSIYLNPFQVKVIFNNQNQKDLIVVKSEQSLETKLIPIYGDTFICGYGDNETFIWEESIISNIKDTDSKAVIEAIERDKKINRLKGFAYCYLIGANSALSAELLDLRKLSREIRNTTSALVNIYSNSSLQKKNSYSSKGTFTRDTFDEVKQRLNELNNKVYKFKSIFISVSGNEDEQKSAQKDYLLKFGFNSEDYLKIITFLDSIRYGQETLYHVFKTFIQSENPSKSISNLPEYIDRLVTILSELFELKDPDNHKSRISYIDKLLQFIDDSVKYLEGEINKKSEKFNPENSLAFANNKLTYLSDKSLKGKEVFYQALINDFLIYQIDGVEDFKINKNKLALDGGKVFLEYLKDRDSSKEKQYINGLLDHIESYKSFDIKSHGSEILQSFSCFIIKGESPEKLLDYLIINNIGDFRIGLGFWGSIFGFANIPKTLTDQLFSIDNDYISRFYRFISKQVLAVSITESAHLVTYPTLINVNQIINEIELPFGMGPSNKYSENERFNDALWLKVLPFIKNYSPTQQKKIKESFNYVMSYKGNKYSSDIEFFVNHLRQQAKRSTARKPESRISEEIIASIKTELEAFMQE